MSDTTHHTLVSPGTTARPLSTSFGKSGLGDRLRFLHARLRRDEAGLQAWSDTLADLKQAAAGQRIAVVGNARSLGEKALGADIDAHDIVLRMNSAPQPAPHSHGTRTDWLATSIPLKSDRLAQLSPDRLLWMTRKRKRLPYDYARRNGFFLNPPAPMDCLSQKLGGPPSTGMMVLELMHSLPFETISVYGFDFFKSLSNSGRRTAEQVPHDFGAEQSYSTQLFASDPRFHLF